MANLIISAGTHSTVIINYGHLKTLRHRDLGWLHCLFYISGIDPTKNSVRKRRNKTSFGVPIFSQVFCLLFMDKLQLFVLLMGLDIVFLKGLRVDSPVCASQCWARRTSHSTGKWEKERKIQKVTARSQIAMTCSKCCIFKWSEAWEFVQAVKSSWTCIAMRHTSFASIMHNHSIWMSI